MLKILFIFTAERKNKLSITSDPAQMADEETSDAAGNKGGNQRPFPDSLDAPQRQPAKNHCQCDQCRIKSRLCAAKIESPMQGNRIHDSLPWQHEHMDNDLQGHPQGAEHRAGQQHGKAGRVRRRLNRSKQEHGEVNESRKQKRNRRQQQLYPVKAPAQDQDLRKQEQHVDRKGGHAISFGIRKELIDGT